MDELIFSASHKGWTFSERFDLGKASESDVSHALAHIREHIEAEAFCNAGINCSMIEQEVPSGNGVNQLVSYLNSRKPGEWKAFLLKAAGRDELLQAAEAKFICEIQQKFGLLAKISTSMVPSDIKPQKQELMEGQIALIGRYKEWIAIKKLGMGANTQCYEVSGILSSVTSTLVKKSFDFLKPDRSVESIADAATKGKRKSFVNLADALKQISPSLTGDKIRDAYLLKCVFENLGFAPYATVEVLTPAYPDLKAPKPRGRVSKG